MKANAALRRKRQATAHEQGVSTVLGAVLVFALFVVTLAIIQVQFVPVWQKQKEANLASAITNQVAQINADMGRQVGNSSAASVADPLTLGASGFTFFSGNSQPGTLTFTPAANGLTLASNQFIIQEQAGVGLYGLGETWQGMVTGTSVTGVVDVQHLRMRLSNVASAADQATTTLNLVDAAGAYAGKMVVLNNDKGSDLRLDIKTYSAASQVNPISSESVSFKKQDAPATFYYDALNPNYLFLDVVAAAQKPMRIDTVDGGITSDFTITYDQQVGGVIQRVGGQGSVVPNYSRTSPGGTLQVIRTNTALPSQTFTLEYGAIILDQAEGSTMAVRPTFVISAGATQVQLLWSVPGLTGQANTISGSAQANVNLSPAGGGNSVQALAPRVSFTLATAHPTIWATFWDETLSTVGLTGNVAAPDAACSASDFHYTICTTANTATLNVYGPTTAKADTATSDIFLVFRQAGVDIRLEAAA